MYTDTVFKKKENPQILGGYAFSFKITYVFIGLFCRSLP